MTQRQPTPPNGKKSERLVPLERGAGSRLTRGVAFRKPNERYSARDFAAASLALLLVAALHVALVFALVASGPGAGAVSFGRYLTPVLYAYTTALAAFLIFYPVFVMAFVRPKRLFSYLKEGYGHHLFSKERLLFSYPVLLIIPLDKSVYSSFKKAIPSIVPFRTDEALRLLDRAIFFGHDPWRALWQLGGHEQLVRAIDFLYHPVWLTLLVVTLLYHALGRHELKQRLRFFLAYVLVWALLGNGLALLLSSAGPCYFSEVTGRAEPYREVMRLLHAFGEKGEALTAVLIQERLWQGHFGDMLEYGGGISAMPSLHIATALLFALGMRGSRPVAGRILYAYTALIWAGSVALGWHYAVDGMVSAVLVPLIWMFAGRLTERVLPERKERKPGATAP